MQVKVRPYEMKMIKPFGLSRSTRTVSRTVLIELNGEGYGEAGFSSYYGETQDTVVAFLKKVCDGLHEDDLLFPEATMERISASYPKNGAAKAAIDMAILDIAAKRLGVPLYQYLGLRRPDDKRTSFTIGIASDEEMLEKVEEAAAYPVLKIKLGRDPEQDIRVMKAVRKTTDKTIRVDANGGWNLDTAVRCIKVLADLGVEYVEQPLERGSLEALAKLKAMSPLPIFVDEDVMVSSDIPRLAGKCDGINIKLIKCGGILHAREMVAVARAFGLQTMLGCMVETSVGITAGAHIASLIDYLDLDGNLLIANDPFEGVKVEDGYLRVPDRPGLGVVAKDDLWFASGS
jgi:L-alanine-DL-glutamate epimerase-like enolase superfamily enzyme